MMLGRHQCPEGRAGAEWELYAAKPQRLRLPVAEER